MDFLKLYNIINYPLKSYACICKSYIFFILDFEDPLIRSPSAVSADEFVEENKLKGKFKKLMEYCK